MTHIVLTDDQARLIEQARGPLELRDSQGRALARAEPYSAQDAELIARSRRNQTTGGARVPSATVQDHLRRLEALAAQESLDEARVLDLLRRMRAGEQV